MDATTTPTAMAATRRPEYALWKALRQRCTNPKAAGLARFGGRGVGLDPRWRGPGGFSRFLADVGPQPFPKAGLVRIDPAGDFVRGNVRWADTRPCRPLTHNGRTMSIAAWAEELNVRPSTLRARLHDGLPAEWVFARRLRNGMWMKPFAPQTRPATEGSELATTEATAHLPSVEEAVGRALEGLQPWFR